MEKTELGIDEAGRGPVLGPMVLAGVLVPESGIELLNDWGIRDSKVFGSSKRGQQQRELLAQRIMSRFAHRIVVLEPETIDRYVEQGALNRLEQETARGITRELPADRVVLDGHNLFKPLTGPGVMAVNKADVTYPSVAAASILAKSRRDMLFSGLCLPFAERFGLVSGGGYANAKTLAFVRWHLNETGKLPVFYRKSYRWKALESV